MSAGVLESQWLWVAMGYGRGVSVGGCETIRQIFDYIVNEWMVGERLERLGCYIISAHL